MDNDWSKSILFMPYPKMPPLIFTQENILKLGLGNLAMGKVEPYPPGESWISVGEEEEYLWHFTGQNLEFYNVVLRDSM